MKKIRTLILALSIASSLGVAACDTVAGAGKDIQNGGKDLQNSADRNK